MEPLSMVALDETGRGAGAGVLCGVGIALPDNIHSLLGKDARYLRDSKSLSPARRAKMNELIRAHAIFLHIEFITVEEINIHGVQWANLEVFRRIVETVDADEYIIDGTLKPHQISAIKASRIRCLPKADALVPAVSAASIVGKVARDQEMAMIHRECPHCREMGYDQNAGYLSPQHIEALKRIGPCPLHHRRTFVTTVLATRKARR